MQALALMAALLVAPDATVVAVRPATLPDVDLAAEAAGAAPGQSVSIIRREDGAALRITLDGSAPGPAPSLANLVGNSDPASIVQARLQLAVDVKLDLGR